MRTNSFLFICSAMILWSGQALAAKWPLQVSKGDTVVVKVPLQYWHPEESSFSQPTTPIFSVDTAALAKLQWQTAGLPYFGEFVVTKVTLRHSRKMDRLCLQNLTQQPAFGGDDNA
jgi:hypothetical protein